jgi:hypothetical protein
MDNPLTLYLSQCKNAIHFHHIVVFTVAPVFSVSLTVNLVEDALFTFTVFLMAWRRYVGVQGLYYLMTSGMRFSRRNAKKRNSRDSYPLAILEILTPHIANSADALSQGHRFPTSDKIIKYNKHTPYLCTYFWFIYTNFSTLAASPR